MKRNSCKTPPTWAGAALGQHPAKWQPGYIVSYVVKVLSCCCKPIVFARGSRMCGGTRDCCETSPIWVRAALGQCPATNR
eukprot:7564856-Alexandrium_andersonii.AAC.1